MKVKIDNLHPYVIENISVDVIAITVDKLENKLHKLLPKVDKASSLISVLGIIVSIVFGIISYCGIEENNRPSWILVLLLSICILSALVTSIILLVRSLNSLSAEKIIEEIKKDCSNDNLRTRKGESFQNRGQTNTHPRLEHPKRQDRKKPNKNRR